MENEKEFEIKRLLNAPLDLVWKVHTEAKHMQHWWGPKGFKMVKCDLDLKPGGILHYGLQAPDGSTMWGKLTYREIIPQSKLVTVVSFSDENCGITRHPMSDKWPLETINHVTFKEIAGKTEITIKSKPLNALPVEIEMFNNSFEGMNQGFGGMFETLEDYLKSQN